MPQHFYNSIFNLRQHEEFTLYDRILVFTPEDETLVQDFLQIEYDTECLHYPFAAPAFNRTAALWAAKTTYTSCQLLLSRENREGELTQLLPDYNQVIDAGAILSADVCLRFLPQILLQTQRIDPNDALIAVIEAHLEKWHYSGIGHTKALIADDDEIFKNDCLLQLYADRVVSKKDTGRALQLPLLQKIRADMGIFKQVFWKTLNGPDN